MKKKILFLESRYNSFYGAQKSMLKLIQSLDNNLFDCKVVTTEEGMLKQGFEKNNVPVDVVRLGKKANVFGGKALEYSIPLKMLVILQILFYNIKMVYYIIKNKIDIVYVNDLRALLYSVLATKILFKKNVWYIRSDVSDALLTNIGLKFSDNIITIAHGVLRELPKEKVEKYSYKITNIYTGFDFDQFNLLNKEESKKSFGVSENKLVIGYIGSINERKGLDILVDAFIDLNKERNDIELLVVGDVSPGYEDYWNAQLDKLRKAEVSFKHKPFCEEVSKAYSAMDIFVLPSRSEGLPRVVIEAMGHQLPVVATDVGGTREIIIDNSLGIIIEKDEAKDLIRALRKFDEDHDYRVRVAEAGRFFVKVNFSHEKFEKNINTFLRNIET